MERDYIIEEVRAIAWTMRLRDPVTGDIVEVPMTPGTRFSPSAAAKNGVANGHEDAAPASTNAVSESPVAAEPMPEAHTDADTDDSGKDEEDAPRRRKRRKGPRANKKTEAHTDKATEETPPTPSPASTDSAPADPLATPEGQRMPVDETTLSVDDRAAWEKLQRLFRKADRKSKRGDLGWEETTEEGRSGIFARWGKGQFKILHAGNDVYALFYEWDGGKWERLACGGAEDLMKLAAARAEEEAQLPPLTTVNLEHARLLCGTRTQQASALERLEPIFPQLQRREDRERRRAEATAPKVSQPKVSQPSAETPTPAPAPADETAAMDGELMSSFTTELDKVLDEEDD